MSPYARAFVVLVLILAAWGPSALGQRVLFLTHSAGFCHEVVKRPSPEVLSFAELELTAASRRRFEVVCTQDCSTLTAENLARFQVVAFYTTGELPITDDQKLALMSWIMKGGGFVGIHCATDTFYQFAPYGDMIGGYFNGHPWHEPVRAIVEDPGHPTTVGLGAAFEITDEIYQHKLWSRDRVHVLTSLDPASVAIEKGARADRDYALSWCRSWGSGRVFYTALGHRPEVWKDPRFMVHLLGGLQWASGRAAEYAALPATARVLFDGSSGAAFQHKDGKDFAWKLDDAAMEVVPGTGDLLTRERFGAFRLHLEFRTPIEGPERKGQERGNSGLYLHGSHELQVLDSFGIVPGLGDCGAIYGVKVPDRAACLEPGVWQSYDVTYAPARFENGRKVRNARISAFLNGILIHDDIEVPQATTAGMEEREGPGPILLQDHGRPVRYRNLRIAAEPSGGG